MVAKDTTMNKRKATAPSTIAVRFSWDAPIVVR
jgi:hypothetical protein